MRLWLAVAFAVLSSSTVQTQTSSVEKVVVLEKGIYRADTVMKRATPGTTGVVNTVSNMQLVSSTSTIPGLKGTRFGLRYLILGAPSGASVDLDLVIRFPSTGLINTETRTVYRHTKFSSSKAIGATGYREYQFEHDWEVVPGVWTFEFWHRNHKVGEEKFCVVAIEGVSSAGNRNGCFDLVA